jgi:hypothetical protein
MTSCQDSDYQSDTDGTEATDTQGQSEQVDDASRSNEKGQPQTDESWTNVSDEVIGINYKIPPQFAGSETYVENKSREGDLRSAEYLYKDSLGGTSLSVQYYFGENGDFIYNTSKQAFLKSEFPENEMKLAEVDGSEAFRSVVIVDKDGRGDPLEIAERKELLQIKPSSRSGSFRIVCSGVADGQEDSTAFDQIINSIRLD